MTRLLLRIFPAAWRGRYGDELLDLVADTGLSAHVAADLVRAGLRERVRAARAALTGGTSMIFAPAWRHPTAWAVVGVIFLTPTLGFVALSALTTVPNPLNNLLNSQRVADLLLVISPAVAALFAGVPLVRLGVDRVEGSSELSLSVRLRAANVVVVVLALGIGSLLVVHIVFESVMRLGA
jgi:hypothetical protein